VSNSSQVEIPVAAERGVEQPITAPQTYEHLLFERSDRIAIITLNHPERRNALSSPVMRELLDCLAAIAAEPRVSAVILASTGSVFSSGHDLRELVDGDEPRYREVFDLCCQLMLKIQAMPQPVIAEVQGMATAAGCQLVATCDLAVACDTATFATPGVRIGLFCSTPMVALSRAVGRKRALQMLLTGEAIDARTAAEWGLINLVVPAAGLRSRTLSLAGRIASASHFTVETGKHAFYRQIDMDTADAYALTKEVMTANALAADAEEGISAFLEKRQPCWKGR
jgi:enoyl-CoA hydratase/carnithine racemase